MRTHVVRRWAWVHRWSSLVSTAFLLLLCLTGLPLVFHHEIDDAFDTLAHPRPAAAGVAPASLDDVVDAARKAQPGWLVQYAYRPPDEKDRVIVSFLEKPGAPPDTGRSVVVGTATADVLGPPDDGSGFMGLMFRLHVDLFAGLPGKLFLGLMAALLLVALVSGTVLYAPFMQKLAFGTVRTRRATRVRWLDLHNLLGIVTLVWTFAVGATGMVNTWADLVMRYWQADQLAAMLAPYRGSPPPARLASLTEAVATARRVAPSMELAFVAFPGTPFASPHHYGVFLRGTTPLTARLLKPVLVDARTGALTDSRDLPWYVTALLLSQPLHFGDYGGLPMKVVWAALDLVTIVVLGSGLYLWFAKRRASAGVVERDGRSRLGAFETSHP